MSQSGSVAVAPSAADECSVFRASDGVLSIRRGATTVIGGAAAPRGAKVRISVGECFELASVVTARGLTLLSTFTGEVVGVLPCVAHDHYAVGGAHVAWATRVGVCAVNLSAPSKRRIVHRTTRTDYVFALDEDGTLHVVEGHAHGRALVFPLHSDISAMPMVKHGHADADSVPRPPVAPVGPLTYGGGRVWWVVPVCGQRASACGQRTHPEVAGPLVVSLSLGATTPPAVLNPGGCSVVGLGGGVVYAALAADTLDVIHVVAVDAESRVVLRTTCQTGSAVALAAHGSCCAVHAPGGRAAILPNFSRAANPIVSCMTPRQLTSQPVRVCPRCREATLAVNMGDTYCYACTTIGSLAHHYGMAMGYLATVFRYRPTRTEAPLIRRKIWGQRPRCWVTGRAPSRKLRVVLAPIDARAPLSERNVMPIVMALAKSQLPARRMRELRARSARALGDKTVVTKRRTIAGTVHNHGPPVLGRGGNARTTNLGDGPKLAVRKQ